MATDTQDSVLSCNELLRAELVTTDGVTELPLNLKSYPVTPGFFSFIFISFILFLTEKKMYALHSQLKCPQARALVPLVTLKGPSSLT